MKFRNKNLKMTSGTEIIEIKPILLNELFHTFSSCRDLCEQMLCLMKPTDHKKATVQKVLDAPINIAQMVANETVVGQDISSIWVVNRDDNLVCIIFLKQTFF